MGVKPDIDVYKAQQNPMIIFHLPVQQSLNCLILFLCINFITMKTSTLTFATLGFTATGVVAFPALSVEYAQEQLQKLERQQKRSLQKEERKRTITFDPVAQYVSTSGDHEFIPPNFDAGDVRGPCPGLNAAANHGYIDHSGVATIPDIIGGVNAAYGMALDLGAFLAVYGAVYDGNGLGYSIGGPTSDSQLPLDNVLGITGSPQGLSGSHNKYESDTSPTRGDLYMK